jgi:hypothetical protein
LFGGSSFLATLLGAFTNNLVPNLAEHGAFSAKTKLKPGK